MARELKYHSPATDLEALQRELSGGDAGSPTVGSGPTTDTRHRDGSPQDGDRTEETYLDEDDVYRR